MVKDYWALMEKELVGWRAANIFRCIFHAGLFHTLHAEIGGAFTRLLIIYVPPSTADADTNRPFIVELILVRLPSVLVEK